MGATGAGESVTIIVHGTYAEDETWWKPGTTLKHTAADNLEYALQHRGMHGSVWRGVRDEPAPEIDLRGDKVPKNTTAIDAEFGWSGRNRHRDRVRAAEQLGNSLEGLARRGGHHEPNADPLKVHIVAHSHGGNVALEMMKDPPANVDLRSVTMLGTPLIWSFATFRLARIGLSLLFVIYLSLFMAELFELSVSEVSMAEAVIEGAIVFALSAWAYVWLTRAFVFTIRLSAYIWRAIFHGGRPPGRPAYGPRPPKLREVLGREIVLLHSREDEADLMMHLGASPWDAYRSLVQPHPPRLDKGIGAFFGFGLIWLVEIVAIRPWVYILLVPIAEATVESFGLGFPWKPSMFRNQEMVSQRDRGQLLYGKDTIIREEVTKKLLPTLEQAIKDRASEAVYIGQLPDSAGEDTEADMTSESEHLEALKVTFHRVWSSLTEQFNLRHSMYYESMDIIEMVADEIVAAEMGRPSPLSAPLATAQTS